MNSTMPPSNVRLRGVLKEHLEALPIDLTVDDLDRRREAKGVARRSARGRGITLLAAAALLLVGGALAAGSGLLRLPTVVPPVPEPSLIAVATASPDATSPSPSDSAAPSASPIPVAGPGGMWIATGPMGTPRSGHTAVRLPDGRVLVMGGSGGHADLTSAELYDPASGTWSATGAMVHPLGDFPATLLRDGRVLVGDVTDDNTDHPTYGAELYDPTSGTWTATGSLGTKGGVDLTATLLTNGKVLVDGRTPRLYDPDSGTWTATGQMVPLSQFNYTATLLTDGRVLVVGGEFPSAKAQLFDPDTGSWTATAEMRERHQLHDGDMIGVALLRDGTVLVAGRGTAELYDPATETWTATPEPPALDTTYSSSTLLPDGTVLMVGSNWSSGGSNPGAELYDPTTGSWTKVEPMLYDPGTATLLLDGTVLVAGGSSVTGALSSAQLYVPAGVSVPAAVVALPTPAPTPVPTPTPIPTPVPTPYPPAAGPVPAGARTWTVTVVNKSSKPGTLFMAEDGENGIGQLCGSVTPNAVPAGVAAQVTFLLPPTRVTDCWIWVNPVPGQGGSMFQTSDAPMAGRFVIQEGENGAQGGWLGR